MAGGGPRGTPRSTGPPLSSYAPAVVRPGVPAAADGPAVLSREAELERLAAFLAAPGPPRSLILLGDPGIGKTTVWEAGLALAAAAGHATLSSRASESETGLSFSALADLMEGIDPGVLAGLPTPQRRAMEVAVRLADAAGDPPDPLAIATGLLGALRALADRAPVLVAVDDVQWLDGSSAEPLRFAARRLRDERVRFLLSRRPAPPGPLEAALAGGGVEALQLAGLSSGAIGYLVAERLGTVPPRRVLRQVYDASAGNPLVALELGRRLQSGEPGIGQELPFPHMVEEVFGARVAALGDPARRALLAASLSADLRPAELAALVDPLEVEEAVASGILVLDRGRVRPAHPLLAAAARHDATAPARRALHGDLAAVVRDPVLRARHLATATAGPDLAVAGRVAAASELAAARGAAHEAEELSAHALRLTPPGAAERPERVTTLARRLLAVGDLPGAEALLRECLHELAPGRQRAAGRLLLGQAADMAGEVEQLELALREAGADPEIRATALVRRSILLSTGRVEELDRAERWALDALDAARQAGGGLEWTALAALAWARILRGRPVDDLCPAGPVPPGLSVYETSVARPAAVRLAFRGELHAARRAFGALLQLSRDHGELRAEVAVQIQLCELALRAGHVEEAGHLLVELDQWGALEEMAAVNARLHAVRAAVAGRPEEVGRWSAAVLDGGDAHRWGWDRLETERAVGLAALMVHDADGAVPHLAAVWEHTTAARVDDPGAFPVAPDLVEALVLAERPEDARRVTAQLADAAGRQQHPWGQATAQRCAALAELHDGYSEPAAVGLASAADAYGSAGLDFDRARSLLALGRAQRRAKKRAAARRSLEDAAEGFDRCGCAGWAELARAELGRVSGRRPGAGHELTPNERRVADLAAQGLSNKEIAARLYISVHTVEEHLTHTYAKLGVRSRGQLAQRMSALPG